MIRHALCTVLAMLACATLPIAAKNSRPPLFVPDTGRTAELVLRGATWTLAGPTYSVHLRRINDTERLNYIAGRVGQPIDPFATPPGKDPRFMTFLVLIENRGETDVGYNALESWLKTNHAQLETPLGLTDLSFAYRSIGQDFPVAYERIGPLLLDRGYSIRPGESFSGLLVYHVVKPQTQRFHVDVDLKFSEGDVVKFRAPYRREKRENKGSGDG